MKQKISPTSPKKRKRISKEIEKVYHDSDLEHVTKPGAKPWNFSALFLFLFISIIGGALAAIVVLSEADRFGFITVSQSETRIIVRDGAEKYSQSESFKQAFVESVRPSVLRLYARELPEDDDAISQILNEGSFVGYGVILTSDGKSLTSFSVLEEERGYIAENWKGEFQEINNIVRDEISGLAFFTFNGSGFTATDIMSEGDSFPFEPSLVFDYRPSYKHAVLSEKIVKKTVPTQLLSADLYIWSSQQFFSEITFIDAVEYPRGAPVYKGDGSLLGIFDGSKTNPVIRFMPERSEIITTYLSSKDISYPYLGVHGLDASFISTLDRDTGFILTTSSDQEKPAVVENSPADDAGLEEGDIIISVNGRVVNAAQTIGQLFLQSQNDSEIILGVIRGDEERTFSVILSRI